MYPDCLHHAGELKTITSRHKFIICPGSGWYVKRETNKNYTPASKNLLLHSVNAILPCLSFGLPESSDSSQGRNKILKALFPQRICLHIKMTSLSPRDWKIRAYVAPERISLHITNSKIKSRLLWSSPQFTSSSNRTPNPETLKP